MMAYNAYNEKKKDPLTYKAIKRFVKMAKCHRNIADQDKAFVEKAWRQAILDYDENWLCNWVMMKDTISVELVSFIERWYDGIFYVVEGGTFILRVV